MTTTRKTVKAKKCAVCSKEFTPFKTTDRVCSYACASALQDQKEREKLEKDQDNEKKTQELHKELTALVNRFIRLRDRGKGCITCDRPLGYNIAQYDAGHCFGVGAYPELRYHLDNINGQCKECNQDKGGKYDEYRELLPKRIGADRFNDLEILKNHPRKYTAYELKALILRYKKKVKTLENEVRPGNRGNN